MPGLGIQIKDEGGCTGRGDERSRLRYMQFLGFLSVICLFFALC